MTDQTNFLTAEEILAGGEERYKVVTLKTIKKGGEPALVRVRPLSARAVVTLGNKMKSLAQGEVTNERVEDMAGMIHECIVDENGERLFTKDNAKRLSETRFDAFMELAQVAMSTFMVAAAPAAPEPEPPAEPEVVGGEEIERAEGKS